LVHADPPLRSILSKTVVIDCPLGVDDQMLILIHVVVRVPKHIGRVVIPQIIRKRTVRLDRLREDALNERV
jgi:hypothetical protein